MVDLDRLGEAFYLLRTFYQFFVFVRILWIGFEATFMILFYFFFRIFFFFFFAFVMICVSHAFT